MSIVLNGDTGITTPGLTNTGTETIVNLTTTGNTTLGDATTDTLTVGVTGIVKDASGNVGIGTASPRAAGGYTSLCLNNATTGTFIDFNTAGTRQATITATTALFDFQSALTAPMTFSTNGAVERMRIDSSGNVGIGTSSPGARLQVTNTDGEMARFRTSSGSNQPVITINASDSAATVGFATGGNASFPAMTFANGGSERMRIGSDGAVFINTTSNWSGNAILNVVGANWVVSSYSTGTATNTGAFLSRVDNTNCRLMMFYYGATTNVGYITTNGTTTSYGSASDYRLKENIAPMTGALAKVALLKPVTYTWKSDGSDGQGFIAHELQEVVPNCVAGEKDAVDSDGKPQYQGVDTSFLVATLTAAIQEQQALITALTARIEALETK